MDRWELMGEAGSNKEEKREELTLLGERGTGRENDETWGDVDEDG